jgi:hypothetical protein
MDLLLLTVLYYLAVLGYPSHCRLFDNASILRNAIKRGTQEVSLSGQLVWNGQWWNEGKEQTDFSYGLRCAFFFHGTIAPSEPGLFVIQALW